MKYRNDPEYARSLTQKIIGYCRDFGVDEVAVQLNGDSTCLTRFAQNQIIQNVARERMEVSLAVSTDQREALIIQDGLNDSDLRSFCRKAADLVKVQPRNPEHMPPVKPYNISDCRGFDPETANLCPEEKAQKIKSVCQMSKSRDHLSFGTLDTGQKFTAVGNSEGHFAFYPETLAAFTLTIRTRENSGSSRKARHYYRISEIDIESLVRRTMDQAEKSQNPVALDPGDYTVVMRPTAAVNYLMSLFWALDARRVDEGQSPLTQFSGKKDPVGSRIFSPDISIFSRTCHPAHPSAPFNHSMNSAAFWGGGNPELIFSRGLPVKSFPVVENGVLKMLFTSRYWAEKKNQAPVAFPTLLEFSGTNQDLDGLVANVENGLLVNSFWYIRFVDANSLLLTGLTRDGVFRIRDGKIAEPVKNLRFNESPLVSLANITEVGQAKWRQAWSVPILMPPMTVENMTFTAQTDAV